MFVGACVAGGVGVGVGFVVVLLGRRDEEERLVADDAEFDPVVVDWCAEDSDVEFVGVDLIDEPFGEVFLDGEFGVGVAVLEVGDDGWEEVWGDCGDSAES